MTIEEYKKKIIELVKSLEKEHNCNVLSMELETFNTILAFPNYEKKEYELKIMLS